ncbi:hypothetical protein GQ457_01G024640 [Hibiscus cannabinus]
MMAIYFSLPFTDLSPYQLSLLAFLCWNLWKARNEWIFRGISMNPIEVWNGAEQKAAEFSKISSLPPEWIASSFALPFSWTPPPEGTTKVNCDASFLNSSKEACIAVVIRDSLGNIIGGASKAVFIASASVAEALVCRLGVITALRYGCSKIIIESNNRGVITRLSSGSFSN